MKTVSSSSPKSLKLSKQTIKSLTPVKSGVRAGIGNGGPKSWNRWDNCGSERI